MKKLHFYTLTDVDDLASPIDDKQLSLHSLAIDFFTDFEQVKPLVIEATMSAHAAKQLMQKAHVRLKFVVDSEDHFLGVVSHEDLNEQQLVMKLSEGFKSSDIEVGDVMQPKHRLKAFDINELKYVSIAEVIDALKESGQQHCLVLDRQSHRIRGIFSASDISRKLHLPIDISARSNFYKVFAATSSK